MNAYADSSFLLSLLVEDGHSDAARRFMMKHQAALPFNPLHRLEVRNGIRLRVQRKEIGVGGRDLAFRQLADDLAEGLLVHQPMPWTEALRRAEVLSAAHADRLGNRSADTLHVAAALLAGLPRFLSFDKRQRALAKAAGLEAKP